MSLLKDILTFLKGLKIRSLVLRYECDLYSRWKIPWIDSTQQNTEETLVTKVAYFKSEGAVDQRNILNSKILFSLSSNCKTKYPTG